MDLFNILLMLLLGAVAFYYIFLRGIYFFKRNDIEYSFPLPFLGNMAPFMFRRLSIFDMLNNYYMKYKDLKYFGFFDLMSPTIVIRDPELFTSIAIKNFDNFVDHRFTIDSRVDPLLGKNLFNINGDHWRDMRKLLSPSFTLSKMKMMFELIRECASNTVDFIADESKTGKIYDMKELNNRYTVDAVASCAFGISVNSMKDPGNDFYTLSGKTLNLDGIVTLKMFFARSFPFLSILLGIKIFSKEISDFFYNLVSNTVKMRNEKGIVRPDMIQLMMDANKEGGADLSIEDMTAHAFAFFFAGFEANSTMLAYMFHEVALNPEIQETLRKEIDEVMKETNGQPQYESVMSIKYLDAVANETLRLYPLTSFLNRICTKEFELPPPKPGGKSVKLKPGVGVWYLPYSIQQDPNYYTNPKKFDPERFLNNKPDKSIYVPFGLGPRICVASRFAMMQAKAMMFYALAKCEVEPCAKTAVPMTFSKKSFLMRSADGFWLKIKSRKLAGETNVTLKA